MKYIVAEAFIKLLSYMNDMFKFQPNIIHLDFDKALAKAILNSNITKNTIHIKCFFHFSQMIRKNIAISGLCKRKMNKRTVEILRNIEILYFLNKTTIKKKRFNINKY